MKPWELSAQLKGLEALVEAAQASGNGWRQVWSEIRSISAAFRELEATSHEARQELWAQFQATVADVKAGQHEYEERRASLTGISAKHLSAIERQVQLAEFDERDIDLITNIISLGAYGALVDVTESIFGEFDAMRAYLIKRGEHHRAAGAYLRDNKTEMLGHDKQQASALIERALAKLQHDWREYHEKRSQARSEVIAARRRRQEERAETSRLAKERLVAAIASVESGHERLQASLQHKLAHKESLVERLGDTYNESARERVSGYIDQVDDAIASIRAKLDDCGNTLFSMKRRLQDWR